MPSFKTDKCNVADPGSGASLIPGSGMGKKSRSGSGMNIPESLETLFPIFGLKILKFFDPDPGSGIFFDPGSLIRDSGWNNSDP